MKIDATQAEAIRHRDGPAMVLAGPGSGKTTVITKRVEYLIKEYEVNPANILVITFSRAAAMEMRERFFNLMGRHSIPVTFGTFHATYFHILKCAYGYTGKNIAAEEKCVQFIREFVRRLRLEYEDESDFIQNILREIAVVKSTEINLENYYSTNCGEEMFRTIFRAYQDFLRQNRWIDFDDMLVYTKELLEKREDILRGWQRKFKYILIDEFQDINLIQYKIIRMLALPQNNLFIVGDDDQSIYRFRGAKPEIMLDFERDYPESGEIKLVVNYRSGSGIVKMAGNLISHNRRRFTKHISANTESGVLPLIREFQDQREQNIYVIKTIQALCRKDGVPYEEMAILFRTNLQPGLLIRQFFDYNIPFVSKEHVPNLYEHWIAKDLLTYISLARGERSRAAFLKVMNRPRRYLSRESLPYEDVDFDVWEEYYSDRGWMVERIEKMKEDLNALAKMRPYPAINYIRKAIGYEEYLSDFAAYRKMPEDELFAILDEIQESAKEYSTYGKWSAHMNRVKKDWEKQFQTEKKFGSAVRMCTLHSAKGLEFDTVFIVDVNETIIPSKKAVLEQDVEEERRMFYVGMTRAKRRLYLLHSKQIHNKEMAPSQFLEECVKTG